MNQPSSEDTGPDGLEPSGADRRQHRRFTGPFDGVRVALIDTPIRVYDLSRGGCFITSMHEQLAGVTMTLKLDLPVGGWITVEAVTLPRQNDYGYAVRFTRFDEDDHVRFQQAMTHLENN